MVAMLGAEGKKIERMGQIVALLRHSSILAWL
jgi:hypothetical protein